MIEPSEEIFLFQEPFATVVVFVINDVKGLQDVIEVLNVKDDELEFSELAMMMKQNNEML